MIYRNSLKKNAFTLAETMIVIVVLGIIATLTIPALVNKNKESVAKTKVRKAMAAYESALNKMIIENDLKSHETLTAWAGDAENNCANSSNYFKKVQGDGCIFKTSDGIWWNISNIERPVISFKEITAQNAATITANANSENDKTAFVLVGRFGNDGTLRVDDLAYETANDTNNSKAQVEKLYTLLGLKRSNAGGGNTTPSPFAACNGAETCVVGGITYTKMTLTAESETYEYCDPDEYWDGENGYCGEKNDKWKQGTSVSEEGDYYVALEEFPDNYVEQAHNYDGSTCPWCENENSPDYYNAAKRHCSGNLPTIAQIKSLANRGKLPFTGWYWASEESNPGDAYSVYYYGGITVASKDSSVHIICIGQ